MMTPEENLVVVAARRCAEVRHRGYMVRAQAMDALVDAIARLDATAGSGDFVRLLLARAVELRRNPELVNQHYVWAVEADQVKVEDFAFARAQELEEFVETIMGTKTKERAGPR